jgi:hypothetical protein
MTRAIRIDLRTGGAMQMKRVAAAVVLVSFILVAGLAKADSIPIGQLSYLGTTPDGSSIFKVSLNA